MRTLALLVALFTSLPIASVSAQPPRRDLAADERCGGHTIARHVGKTNRELAERLRQQPDISAASTYTDLQTAETVVGAALAKERSRIATWSARSGSRPNLALRYTSPRRAADRPVVAARQGRAQRLLPGSRRAALGRLARRLLRADVVSRGGTMSVSKKTPRAAARSTRARVTSRSRAAAARQRFPAIEAFCDAYLNQDVHDIYGSPAAAADAFLADASAAEIRKLRAEWTAFRAALPRGASADRLARFQHTFAAGWAPSRFSQVAAVFARLSAPSSRE